MIWLLVLLISNFSSAAPSCPTERQLSANFTRESLEQFIQSNRVKDLDDLTCCMARIPGAQIAIAPHSIAAQNGDTQNPRVLVVIPRQPPFPNVATASRGSTNLAAVFSVNSGAAHLNQKDNLEVMINGSSPSYVDVESTAHHPPRVSRANPQECMSCHGSGGVPSHGPRPIFEAAPWPSFIMENPDRSARAVTDLPNSRDTVGFRLCTYREQLEPEIEKASAEALQRHPRYHCIKDLPRMNIAVLDLLLAEINVPRIVRFITQSKDYEMFKYAILAAEACADFKPEDYIPGHVRGTMNQQTTIDPRLLSLSTREQLREYANRQTVLNNQNAVARDTRFRQDLPRLQRGERVALAHRIEDANCVEQMPAEMISPHNTALFQSRDSVFNRYHADSGIRPHPNVNLRYIFESRGIEISDWNMTPTGGYDRRFNIANELLKRGNFSQEVRALARRSNQRGGCDRLKALSMRAFEKHHPPAPSEPPPVEQ